jgi:hypothetical protein
MAGWRRPKRWRGAAALLMLPLTLAACDGGEHDSAPVEGSSPADGSTSAGSSSATEPTSPVDVSTSAGASQSADVSTTAGEGSAVCGYLYEWLSSFRFPLQPDPHAAYSYVIPEITEEPVALEIRGQFPYAAWTSWTIYTDAQAGAQPFSVVKASDITPDDGSVNPFVVGTPVLAPNRDYQLLVLPQGIDTTTLDESLQDVPMSNILTSPAQGGWFIVANRVYNAFSGYNQGGAAGPMDIPFPTVRAVNYETGEDLDCADVNLLPSPRSPDDMPTGRSPATGPLTLRNGEQLSVGVLAEGDHEGSEYAPAYDPDLIEFTRPPILPGADVPSVDPPDSCAGYLGAATSTTEIGLIRIPHVATWFDTSDLTAETQFAQEEATFFSLTQYGNAVGSYEPGKPQTASLGNAELLVDPSGGSTIVVWPRSLSASDQQQVFDHAVDNGWALLRGDDQGAVTTSNVFVREKGSSPSYQGGYTPTSERTGVPCYFDDNPTASQWNQVTGDQYVASAQNIGPAAPQGVNCTVPEFLDDTCLAELKSYLESTGGSYEAQ